MEIEINEELKNSSEEENEKEKNLIDENNYYLKITFLKNKYINISILLFLILSFASEFIYRDSLFSYSLELEEILQNITPNGIILYFKIITKVGGEYFMAFPLGFVLCFFSLIKSSIYISGFLFVLQFHSMMKIWYGNTRPFWIKGKLYKEICDGGFGNPSGHSITTTYIYLTLFIYLKESKFLGKNLCVQIIIFIIFLFWILLIIFSRIILGLHSLNQIIYGSTLGIIVFLFITQVFKLHQMPILYYKKFFKEKIYIIITFSLLLFLSIFTVINKFIFNTNFEIEKYNNILNEKCGEEYPEYRRFNNDGVFGSFVIFALMGMYLGQILFWYLIDKRFKKNNILQKSNISHELILNDFESEEECEEEDYYNNNNIENINNNKKIDEIINNWNRNRVLLFGSVKNVFKIIFIICLCISPLLLFILISKNSNLFIIFFFKLGIPFFTILFMLYSYGFYYIIKISCGTKEFMLKRINDNKRKDIIDE